MIILSEVCQPADGVRLTQPQVVAYMENESVGEGTLCVAESQVTWICRTSGLGFSLTYPSIILHAISTDISTFPYECVYIVVDASKSGKFFLRFSPFSVQQIYNEMCVCQELNPDENDDFSGWNVALFQYHSL
uniref:Methylosome subunit pICln n=1 Tax=Angiostrongylus cantonensis TaxID=6313 RepID=A0A0K0D6S2_ANGCA